GALIQADIVYGGKSLEYIKFLAPGLVAISIMYGAFFECTYSSFVRMYYQKTFDAILATPLSLEDIIAGEILWGATKSFINATIVLGVIAAFGYAELPGLLLIPLIAFVGGLMFASLAMLFTALVPNMDSFNYPFFLLITPMFLFSGTFFPLSVLPEWGQQLAMALPLTHISNIARDLSYNLLTTEVAIGAVYIIVLTAVCFLASVYLMKKRLVK
ncbi:MAG TPA: ABC transporter permease, partial [Methanomassiliicoccales archaeon]|nr:ABC transporter permease [Methanomassiliicoccales archaeon]